MCNPHHVVYSVHAPLLPLVIRLDTRLVGTNPLMLVNEKGRWGVNGVDAITRK